VVLWGLAAGYLTANYLLLEEAPTIWRSMNRAAGGEGGAVIVGAYVVLAVVGVFAWWRFGVRSRLTILGTLALAGAFALMFWVEQRPGEKFHMLQYGAFGALLFAALRVDLDPRGIALYAVGVPIGVAAGLTDELIQDALPNRVFTVHDVFVNGGSVALVLALGRLHLPGRAE